MTPFPLSLAGQTVDLLPARAAFWREAAALLVADCHFGKAAAFRDHGFTVPEGGTEDDLVRLDALLAHTGATRLVVVGDLFHSPSGYRPEVTGALTLWRERHRALRITLVPGNHDRSLHRLPAGLGLDLAGEPHREEPFAFVHDPAAAGVGGAVTICGHLHPAIRLGDRRVRGVSAPCFWWQRENRLVLPSFGTFTGSAALSPRGGDRVFAIAGRTVTEIPPALFGR